MKKHKKKNRMWALYTGPIFAVASYAAGVYLTHRPFRFDYLTAQDLWSPTVKIALACGICIWFIFTLHLLRSANNLEPGKEYGEARFASPGEILPEIAGDAKTDKILSANLHMSLNDRKHGLNASTLLIGGSGSGKTFRFVTPNILQANSSFAVTDPKGTLLTDYGNYLLRKGYQVKVISVENPSESDCFNPFTYIHSPEDIERLVNDYIRATTPKNASESDPFWIKAESMLCTALIQLMFVAYPDDCTMRRFLQLLHSCKPRRKDGKPTALDQLFLDHQNGKRTIGKDPAGNEIIITGQMAYENYSAVMDSADDTCRSVIISAVTRYNKIHNSPQLVRMLSGHDTVDFRALGAGYNGHMQKTALFIIPSDIDKTYACIALWVLSSLFQELYAVARTLPDNRLPIPVQIYLDEFANIPQNENVLQLFSTARSRNISVTAIVQSIGQLKGMFKDESEVIQGACDTMIYLGSNEPAVHKEIAEQLGKYTLQKQSHSNSTGTHGNSSTNTDSIGKELMSQDRVRMLPGTRQIVFLRGFEPVLDNKPQTEQNVLFKDSVRSDKYDYREQHTNPGQLSYGPMSPDEMDYVRRNHVNVIAFTAEEFYKLPEMQPEAVDYAAAVKAIQNSLAKQHEKMQAELAERKTVSVKERMLECCFTPEQMSEIAAGLESGLEESDIVSYMDPDYAPERMRVLRLLLIQRSDADLDTRSL